MQVEPNPERTKYDALWGTDEYRRVAPGESTIYSFLSIAAPRPNNSVTDFGCGTGRAALELTEYFNTVVAVDFSPNCLDASVRAKLSGTFIFQERDLTDPGCTPKQPTDYGYCTDVMEHIPTKDVPEVINNILDSAKYVFFVIDCEKDHMGQLIGEPLHLTVQPHDWWKEQFESLGHNVIHSFDAGNRCVIYASKWATPSSYIKVSTVNVPDEEILWNIRTNLAVGFEEARPYELQDTEAVILAGGPSLSGRQGEIMELKHRGLPIITVNGAYAWAISQGIKPDIQIVVDAREFNSRFLSPVISSCKYFLASQCSPAVTSAVPKDQVLLWHCGVEALTKALEGCEAGDDSAHYPVTGGTTSVLRGIPLLHMLGVRRFILFGFDSCLLGKDHHAYSQPENDGLPIVDIVCGGRIFKCHPWMVVQASEFSVLQSMMDCEFDVRGDGLISNMIKSSYTLTN